MPNWPAVRREEAIARPLREARMVPCAGLGMSWDIFGSFV